MYQITLPTQSLYRPNQSDVTKSPGSNWPVFTASVNFNHDQKHPDQKWKYIYRHIGRRCGALCNTICSFQLILIHDQQATTGAIQATTGHLLAYYEPQATGHAVRRYRAACGADLDPSQQTIAGDLKTSHYRPKCRNQVARLAWSLNHPGQKLT